MMKSAYISNTLRYNPDLCSGCGMCSVVCPHLVFVQNERLAQLIRPKACMECGACQRNCPTNAIIVESGVGCAYAQMLAALKGKKEACCDIEKDSPCCS
jgi:NAD-dependent dihydropyrimidine dehydrogenase PreA subunit